MYQKPFNKTARAPIFWTGGRNIQPLERLPILRLQDPRIQTFHITWLTFFVCFFGWFGLAPLMPAIRTDLGLTKVQVGNILIASVAATVVARLIVGRLCDYWGPRKTAVRLLIVGSIPVFLVGLSHDYVSFLLFRLCIGVIGASFVITQFHTSLLVAPAIKGTANAVAGGWGNLGGGVTNMIMPLVFSLIIAFGYSPHYAWRYAMILPGVLMLAMAWLYYRHTIDNTRDVRHITPAFHWPVLSDIRIWALVIAYAMCFGMELTFDNVASLHFVDSFKLSLTTAGIWAGVFGSMNLFARAMGGYFSDQVGKRYGLRGKGFFLAGALLLEGVGLILFAEAGSLIPAIACMLFFALFLKMANGGTFGIVPFIDEGNVGLVSGIVGAGGNLGGVLFGFLFRSTSLTYAQAFMDIGWVIIAVSVVLALTRFSAKQRRRRSGSIDNLPAYFAEETVLYDERLV